MEKISMQIVERMCRNGVIVSDDKELYVYSMEIFLEKCIGYVLLAMTALVMQKELEVLLFMIFFSNIRKYTGGYHCKTFFGCTIISVLTCIVSVHVLAPFLTGKFTMFITLFASSLVICIFGAVNHPDMCWTDEECIRNNRKARQVVCIESGIILITYLFDFFIYYTKFMLMGMVVSAGTIVIAKLLGQEVE